MKPVEFKEQNRILMPPPGVSEEECSPLPVFSDNQTCISCWELTPEETVELIRTGRIYLGILSGQSQPPVWVSVVNPFVSPSDDNPMT